MQHLIIKIKKAIKIIENAKGPFQIKCLVAKNPDDIQWDLVLAANWFERNQIKRLEYLSNNILKDFDINDISQFSGIITIDIKSELGKFLIKIQKKYCTTQNSNSYLNDMPIVDTNNNLAPMVVPLN